MTNAELRQAFINRIEVKESDPLDAYKGKWVSQWITKKGLLLGLNTFPSKGECQEFIDDQLKRAHSMEWRDAIRVKFSERLGKTVFNREIIAGFPMPIGDK